MSHDERLVEVVAEWLIQHFDPYIPPQDVARGILDAINAYLAEQDKSDVPMLGEGGNTEWKYWRRHVRAALKAADRTPQPCPELLAAVWHVDAIARSSMRPTKEDYQMSHSLLVDLVLALHPPRVDLGLGQPPDA